MTTPTLAWGQAGQYNAVDDRLVIRSLSLLTPPPLFGVAAPPTLSAGSGLTINIGPWNAIVDCGDGTSAVIGNRAASTVLETAGGASQRTDYIWADINPDGATTTVSVITQAAASGRTGCQLGTVVVPASAATAAAMTITTVASPWQWGSLAADQYGILRYTDNAGLSYALGAHRTVTTGAVTITSTFTQIGNMSFQVGAGQSYRFDAMFRFKQGTTANIAGNIQMQMPATSNFIWFPWYSVNSSSTFFNQGVSSSAGVNVLGSTAANAEIDIWFRGQVTFSASGLWVIGGQAAASAQFTAQPGCEFDVYPV